LENGGGNEPSRAPKEMFVEARDCQVLNAGGSSVRGIVFVSVVAMDPHPQQCSNPRGRLDTLMLQEKEKEDRPSFTTALFKSLKQELVHFYNQNTREKSNIAFPGHFPDHCPPGGERFFARKCKKVRRGRSDLLAMPGPTSLEGKVKNISMIRPSGKSRPL